MRMKNDVPACVYHHYDKDYNLLYVGYTSLLQKRNEHHLKNSKWGRHIHFIISFNYPTRKEAYKVERETIIELKPRYNTHPNRKYKI